MTRCGIAQRCAGQMSIGREILCYSYKYVIDPEIAKGDNEVASRRR